RVISGGGLRVTDRVHESGGAIDRARQRTSARDGGSGGAGSERWKTAPAIASGSHATECGGNRRRIVAGMVDAASLVAIVAGEYTARFFDRIAWRGGGVRGWDQS